MRFKNSLKIVFSNFSIAWKATLYFLVLTIISVFLLYLSIHPIYSLIDNSGLIVRGLGIYSDFLSNLNLSEALLSAGVLGKDVLILFRDNMSTIWINFASIFLIIAFFQVVASNLMITAMCNSLNYYMNSLNNHGFFTSFSETLGKNIVVTLCHYLVSLPINAIIITTFAYSLKLFTVDWWFISFFALFIVIALVIVLFALKTTLFCSWIPSMLIMNYGVWRSLGLGLKTSFRKFWKVFGTAVGVVMTIIALNMFLGLFTLGVGLFISIPLSFLLYSAFGMVATFEGQGRRYYVDVYNVMTPHKKEKSDKVTDMPYII